MGTTPPSQSGAFRPEITELREKSLKIRCFSLLVRPLLEVSSSAEIGRPLASRKPSIEHTPVDPEEELLWKHLHLNALSCPSS